MIVWAIAGKSAAMLVIAFVAYCFLAAFSKPNIRALTPGQQAAVGVLFGAIVGLAIVGVLS